ncbi:MAG: dTDP-glucose 4,6-dehydratase [Dethiobacter sp.]|jgi:dTDP-glucose 4,6-dehydratase|nr:dTDP-glucose 4,6-dehydratase [Dethiobacter sp.]
MARYLITGGAGFIGSNFLSLLLNKKYSEVICIDKFNYAASDFNLQELTKKPNFSIRKVDITNTKELNKLWQKPFDYIINFAAESHVDRSINTPVIFFENNVLGTINLLNKCLEYPPKLFIQISTDEVYGSIPKPHMADESSPLKPSNPYSASKCSADLAVLSYYKTYNLPVVILRAVNNFGPRQYPEKLIPKVIIKILKNKKIPVYGNGQAVRTWLYVMDFCNAILSALGKGIPGEIYNIGSPYEISNLELVENILMLLGKNRDLIEFVDDRPGHDQRYALDYTKANNQLDLTEQYPFDLALKNTVTWYKKSFDYYNNLTDKYV